MQIRYAWTCPLEVGVVSHFKTIYFILSMLTLPFLSCASHHDYHHTANTGNYGAEWLDWMFGTLGESYVEEVSTWKWRWSLFTFLTLIVLFCCRGWQRDT